MAEQFDDHQRRRERLRARQHRDLNAEPTPRRRASWRRRVVAGLVLGSFSYLVVSCYFAHQLDQPKFERRDFRFRHGPPMGP